MAEQNNNNEMVFKKTFLPLFQETFVGLNLINLQSVLGVDPTQLSIVPYKEPWENQALDFQLCAGDPNNPIALIFSSYVPSSGIKPHGIFVMKVFQQENGKPKRGIELSYSNDANNITPITELVPQSFHIVPKVGEKYMGYQNDIPVLQQSEAVLRLADWPSRDRMHEVFPIAKYGKDRKELLALNHLGKPLPIDIKTVGGDIELVGYDRVDDVFVESFSFAFPRQITLNPSKFASLQQTVSSLKAI